MIVATLIVYKTPDRGKMMASPTNPPTQGFALLEVTAKPTREAILLDTFATHAEASDAQIAWLQNRDNDQRSVIVTYQTDVSPQNGQRFDLGYVGGVNSYVFDSALDRFRVETELEGRFVCVRMLSDAEGVPNADNFAMVEPGDYGPIGQVVSFHRNEDEAWVAASNLSEESFASWCDQLVATGDYIQVADLQHASRVLHEAREKRRAGIVHYGERKYTTTTSLTWDESTREFKQVQEYSAYDGPKRELFLCAEYIGKRQASDQLAQQFDLERDKTHSMVEVVSLHVDEETAKCSAAIASERWPEREFNVYKYGGPATLRDKIPVEQTEQVQALSPVTMERRESLEVDQGIER